MAYLLSLIVNGVTRLQNDTHGTNIYADKHIKNNSNDNYILLGGGGHIDKGTFALANHGVHWDGFSKRATSDAIWGALASSNGYSPLFWLDSINGGGVAFSDKSGQTFMQIDGYYYQNEGKNRVTDITETVTSLGTNGNYLTWTKNGTTNNIAVPYAAASTKLQTSRTLWGRPFDGTDDVNGHITMNGEYSLKAYMPRKRADGGGWAYSPLIILDASTNDFAHLGIYGGNNTLNYIYIGSNEYYSTQNLLIYPTGNVEAVRFISNISTGTSPLAVTSTTLCTNLNTDMLDGYHASGLFTALSANSTLSITIGGTTLTSIINAATVDGKYISNYYTKSEADDRFVNVAGDTMSGALIFSGVTGGNYNEGIRIQDASNKWAGITFGATGTTGCSPQSGEVAWFAAKEPGGKFLISPNTNSDTVGLRLEKDGNAYWRNNVIFHSGNYTSYVYSKQQSDDRFVNVTGDTMTGTLTITKYGPTIHNYVSSAWAFQRYTAYDDTHNNMYDIGTYYTRDTFEIRRNGGDNWAFSPNTFYGYANNTYYLGTSSYRWANIYSTLGNFSSTVTAGKFHSNASASTDLTIIPPDTAIALETGNGNGDVNAWIWRENYSSSNWGIFHNNSEDDSINFVGANKIRVKISLGSNSLKVGGTEVSLEGHNHDGRYSLVGHNHDGRYLRKDANDSTPYQYNFTKTDDHAIKVGTIRGTAVGSQTGDFIHLYERVAIGSPSGWGSRNAPTYGLATYGGAWLATDTGNVGIGTTNPTQKLYVNGLTYSVNGFAVANGRLVNNTASGNGFTMQNGNGTNLAEYSYYNDHAYVCNYYGSTENVGIEMFDNGNFSIFTKGSGKIFYALNNGNVGIGTTSPENKLDVNGIQQIYQRGNDNTAFKDLLLLKQQNSTEDAGQDWTSSKPTFGIGFRRYWTSGSSPYGETTCAGIYATISSSWRGGLVFRTKNNETQGGTHDTTPLRLRPDGVAKFYKRIDSCNIASDTSYMNSALQIREYNYGGAQSDTWGNAPRLSWHWAGRVQAQIGLASNNHLYISENNFNNAYRIVMETGTWGISITGSAGSVAWGNVTGKPSSFTPASHNHDTLYPKKDGTGASGSWGISITGSAGSVAWGNVTGKPSTFTPSSHTHYATTYKDSRNEAMTPSKGAAVNGIAIDFKTKANGVGAGSGNYCGLVTFDPYSDESGGYPLQMGFNTGTDTNNTNEVYIRTAKDASTWNSWRTIINNVNYTSYTVKKDGTGATGTWGISITGNAATATKLQTARTLTIGNTGKTFNGSSNVSWTLSEIGAAASSHTHTKSQITDFPSSLPASDVYAWAKAASKPSYSFSEITPGVATIGDGGANRLMFRTNASYRSGIYYSTSGNESMVFANINSVTGWIFATIDPTTNKDWTTLTPSLQIKNGRVTINKLIANGTNAAYNLDVNGSANATTLYENGVRVSVSGHSHSYLPLSGGTCTGNIYAPAFYESSDERLKDFYNTVDVDLDKLSLLPKKFFKWKSNPNGEFEIGTSAQELQKIYPQLVNTDDKGYLTVAYDKLSIIALRAIDKLYEMNKNLERRVQVLESKI